MKILKDILYKARIVDVVGSTNVAIEAVQFDSRQVQPNTLFVAIKGASVDGHQFIDGAIKQGAIAVVCENIPENKVDGITYVSVRNAYEALGLIAANFYNQPSEKITLVGVTGTNGKTTTATLLYKLFGVLGYTVGLISTVENKIGDKTIPSTHTTPDPIVLNKLLAQMVLAECDYCFMEVSSHAVVQGRIEGLDFDGGIFTNITHEHLDYHGSFDEYIKAKKGFFDKLPKHAFALVNKDDARANVMVQNTAAKAYSFGLKGMADFKAKIIENQFSGLLVNINGNELYTKLIGSFNAYNILGVYAAAMLLNQEPLAVLTAISALNSVEGRFQYIKSDNGVVAIVDYAHTPDALQNVLQTIQDIRTGNEKVITVAGCGGDRDREKRPAMAKIACEFSDRVILTSDNPRSEEPRVILDDMKTGVEPQHFKKYVAIEDRREAIKMACSMANTGDIILVAGKGHEKYQEIKGERLPFDDMEILNETLKMLEK